MDKVFEITDYLSIIENIYNYNKDDRQNITYQRKPRIKIEDDKITEIRISQSLIKRLSYKGEYKEVCPFRIKETELLCNIEEPVTLSQLQGNYFEYKCFGASAYGKIVMSLPLNKITGRKLIDTQRIDDAVNRFFYINDKLGIILHKNYIQYNTERIWVDTKHLNNFKNINIILHGAIDFISPISFKNHNHSAAVFDLKLTKDRHNCYPPFCWGCPENMDLTQAILYSNLTHLPFYYYVFDYPKYNPGYKLIPVKTVITHPYDHEAITRNIQLDQIIRWTVSTILEWHELGYPKNPNINMKYESGKTNPESCIKCPITDCNEKSKITAI